MAGRLPLLACALLLCAACTPVRSAIAPPYALRGQTYDETQIRELARRQCVDSAHEQPEHVFTTDGCSFWPDGEWRECCIEHDLFYWCGGATEERRKADSGLRACVAGHSSDFNAGLMYWGVRLGGNRWLPFTWRWGYGHDWPYAPPKSAPSVPQP